MAFNNFWSWPAPPNPSTPLAPIPMSSSSGKRKATDDMSTPPVINSGTYQYPPSSETWLGPKIKREKTDDCIVVATHTKMPILGGTPLPGLAKIKTEPGEVMKQKDPVSQKTPKKGVREEGSQAGLNSSSNNGLRRLQQLENRARPPALVAGEEITMVTARSSSKIKQEKKPEPAVSSSTPAFTSAVDEIQINPRKPTLLLASGPATATPAPAPKALASTDISLSQKKKPTPRIKPPPPSTPEISLLPHKPMLRLKAPPPSQTKDDEDSDSDCYIIPKMPPRTILPTKKRKLTFVKTPAPAPANKNDDEIKQIAYLPPRAILPPPTPTTVSKDLAPTPTNDEDGLKQITYIPPRALLPPPPPLSPTMQSAPSTSDPDDLPPSLRTPRTRPQIKCEPGTTPTPSRNNNPEEANQQAETPRTVHIKTETGVLPSRTKSTLKTPRSKIPSKKAAATKSKGASASSSSRYRSGGGRGGGGGGGGGSRKAGSRLTKEEIGLYFDRLVASGNWAEIVADVNAITGENRKVATIKSHIQTIAKKKMLAGYND